MGAVRATSEQDAVLYVRTAELMRAYHENVAPLERIASLRNTVIGLTEDGRFVAPLALDYAVWTRPVHVFANTLRRSTVSDRRRVTKRENPERNANEIAADATGYAHPMSVSGAPPIAIAMLTTNVRKPRTAQRSHCVASGEPVPRKVRSMPCAPRRTPATKYTP